MCSLCLRKLFICRIIDLLLFLIFQESKPFIAFFDILHRVLVIRYLLKYSLDHFYMFFVVGIRLIGYSNASRTIFYCFVFFGSLFFIFLHIPEIGRCFYIIYFLYPVLIPTNIISRVLVVGYGLKKLFCLCYFTLC